MAYSRKASTAKTAKPGWLSPQAMTVSHSSGPALPRTKVSKAARVSGETASQLALSGVSTRAEAATVRVVSSTAMMTETDSATMAARRKTKRNIKALPRFTLDADQ